MRHWLVVAHQAGKLDLSDDFPEMKQMMEKIGTNRRVKDKAVGVDLQQPYDILLRYKALQRGQEGPEETAKEGRTNKKPEVKDLAEMVVFYA